jgi:hypothetical protein
MLPLRKELQDYARACEELLSVDMYSPLTQEERDLVLYYLNEIAQKYSQQHSGRNPYPTA